MPHLCRPVAEDPRLDCTWRSCGELAAYCCKHRATIHRRLSDFWAGRTSPIPRRARDVAVRFHAGRFEVCPAKLAELCHGVLPL